MSTRRCFGAAGLVGVAYLLLWPVAIEPVYWLAPVSPGFRGPYQENTELSGVELLLEGVGRGPETVTHGPDGFLYTGLRDGRIIRFSADGTTFREFADTRGSPGGMKFDASGNLIVADATRGLLSIDSLGNVSTLLSGLDGRAFLFLDDLDIGEDGRIWFTDATQRFREHHEADEFLEGRPTGRLLTYDPASGEARVWIDELRFANGVALGPDEAFVLINETFGYRTTRLWLKGPKAGTSEPFLSNYPALPDNIWFDGRELFWIAFFMPRDALYDWLWGQSAFLRKIVRRLPVGLIEDLTRPSDYGFVIAVDPEGNVVHNLQAPDGHYGGTTSVLEVNGVLYLGSISMQSVARLPLDTLARTETKSRLTQVETRGKR